MNQLRLITLLVIATAPLLVPVTCRRYYAAPSKATTCSHLTRLRVVEDVEAEVPETPHTAPLQVCRLPGTAESVPHCCNEEVESAMSRRAGEDYRSTLLSVASGTAAEFKNLGGRLNGTLETYVEAVMMWHHKYTVNFTSSLPTHKKHPRILGLHMLLQFMLNSLPKNEDHIFYTETDEEEPFPYYHYLGMPRCQEKFLAFAQRNEAVSSLRQIRIMSLVVLTAQKMERVLTQLSELPLSDNCRQPLTRLHHCSLCEYKSAVRPCKELCDNIVSGCWFSVYNALVQPWKEALTALNRLISTAQKDQYASNIKVSLQDDVKAIFENVRTPREKDDLYRNHRYCNELFTKPPKKTATVADADLPPLIPDLELPLTPLTHTLTQLRRISEKYLPLLSSIPTSVCQMMRKLGRRGSAAGDGQCWNGYSIGRYQQPEYTDLTVDKQISNPEVLFDASIPPELSTLRQELVRITEFVNDHLDTPEIVSAFSFRDRLKDMMKPVPLPEIPTPPSHVTNSSGDVMTRKPIIVDLTGKTNSTIHHFVEIDFDKINATETPDDDVTKKPHGGKKHHKGKGKHRTPKPTSQTNVEELFEEEEKEEEGYGSGPPDKASTRSEDKEGAAVKLTSGLLSLALAAITLRVL